MDWVKVVCFLSGGLALFLYGMFLAGEALQKVAGRNLRIVLEMLTSNRFTGVGVGIFTTICTQSSSATTVMLVSLVNSGLMRPIQTMGVILGADIGTTFTIQIIAFKVTDYALLMVGVGFLIWVLSRYERPKYLGQFLMAFGLIFFGLTLMTEGVAPLNHSEWFREQVMSFAHHPVKGIVVSALFTAVIQSSAATIVVGLALASQGLLGETPQASLLGSIPIILGANIGTCATALLSSIGTNVHARRVAVAHLLFKVAGVAVFYPLISLFSNFVYALSTGISPGVGEARLLANAHTLFNILIAVLFIGFTGQFARLVERLVPEKGEKETGRVDLVDPAVLGSPELAIRSARTAVGRMAEIVLNMLRDSAHILRYEDARLLEDIRRKDEEVDYEYRRISDYLVTMLRKDLGSKEQAECKKLLIVSSGFEKLGNFVSRNLMDAFYQKMSRDVEFSIEGQKELESFHSMVTDFLRAVVDMISRDDLSAVGNVMSLRRDVLNAKIYRQHSHLHRLSKGLRDSRESDIYFMEILYVLDSMAYRATSIVHAMLGTDVEKMEV